MGFINQLRVAVIVLGIPAVLLFFAMTMEGIETDGGAYRLENLAQVIAGGFLVLSSAVLVAGALAGHKATPNQPPYPPGPFPGAGAVPPQGQPQPFAAPRPGQAHQPFPQQQPPQAPRQG
ncbi:hypothetical protein GCM10009678_10360 [Actinomadura kijaniata]|uniref:Uncharacterized protein n=1 Tax=Actinomadura namibiensis TaxID=182080 RepID=A0A7W3LJG7_ACTNM|nr:hypothetical protein [Actinomadura namibiensis]MBA8949224.1 hypothetical protein [Actinomadura namibiensis]